MTSKSCFIFDLDGTIANGEHRLHHIQKSPKDWESFFGACGDDAPIAHICALGNALDAAGHYNIIVSGRSAVCKRQTLAWLDKHFPWYSALYMREAGDHTDDDKLKLLMLAQLRADGWKPIMVFDDRNRVVRAWREAGIPCAQVAEGDF